MWADNPLLGPSEDVDGHVQVHLAHSVGPPDGVAHRVEEGADVLLLPPPLLPSGPETIFYEVPFICVRIHQGGAWSGRLEIG